MVLNFLCFSSAPTIPLIQLMWFVEQREKTTKLKNKGKIRGASGVITHLEIEVV